MNEKVSQSDITDIVEELSIGETKKLYEKLHIEYKIVEKCEEKVNVRDPDEKAKSVLRYWQQREGSKATREVILDALERCGFRNAKQNIVKKWKLSESNESDRGCIKVKSFWESEGLRLEPEVSGFKNWHKIEISYTCGTNDPEVHLFSRQPHILKSVKNTWSGIVRAAASDGETEAECHIVILKEFDLGTLKNDIKAVYRKSIRPVVFFPWNKIHHTLPKQEHETHQVKYIEDIYVDLELEKAERRNREFLTLSVDEAGNRGSLLITKEDLYRIRTSEGDYVKRILLKGLPGSGKSFFLSKIAYEWSKDEKSGVNKYELVFLLRMNRFQKDCTLIDEICRQIIPIDESMKQGLKNYVKQNPLEILILMDAWDETNIEKIELNEAYQGDMTIEQILASQKISQTLVIISSRPHKPLGTIQSEYAEINLKGFSLINIQAYVGKFFGCSPYHDTVQEMLKPVFASENLQTLAQVPIILMILCTVWKESQTFPDTVFALYDEFMNILWKRYTHRSQTDSTTHVPLWNSLGNIALQGLFPKDKIKENIIEFSAVTFRNNEVCDLGLEVGYIIKGWTFTHQEEVFITFLHKSVQEFLAGRYLARIYEENQSEFNTILSRLEDWELILDKFEVLRFCCGVSQQQNKSTESCSSAIISHTIGVYSSSVDVSVPQQVRCNYCNNEDIKDAESYVNIGHARFQLTLLSQRYGSKPENSEKEYRDMQSKAIDCLPIFTLLHEAKLQDASELNALFSNSVFNTPMSVFFDCRHCEVKWMLMLRNFFQRVGFFVKRLTFLSMQSSMQFVPYVIGHVQNLNSLHMSCFSDTLGQPDRSTRISFHDTDDKICTGIASLKNLSTLVLHDAIDNMCLLLRRLSERSSLIQFTHVDFTDTYMRDAIKHLDVVMTPHLTCLILRKVGLVEEHIRVISGYLSRSPNLQKLNLSKNVVGSSIIALTESLMKNCKHLHALILWNTGITERHAQALTFYLSSQSVDLISLYLSGNKVGSSIMAFNNPSKHLQCLSLCSTNLNANHINAIDILPETLRNLELSSNNISGSHIHLIEVLKNCKKLEKLNISSTNMNDEEAAVLGQTLNCWPNLSTLDIFSNYIRANGLHSILTNIHVLPQLREFHFNSYSKTYSALVKKCLEVVTKRGGIFGPSQYFVELNSEDIHRIQNVSKSASCVVP